MINMNTYRTVRRRPMTVRSGFTLIELLTVIAIIAILAAIIFPVSAGVQESARRGNCMSNMQQISSAVKLYELDNRKYPDFLLAPAIKASATNPTDQTPCEVSPSGNLVVAGAGDDVCTLEQASGTGKLGGKFEDGSGNVIAEGGLYPEYVRSLSVFHCPNNSWADKTNLPSPVPSGSSDYDPATTPIARYNATTKSGTAGDPELDDSETFRYYRYDCYDANQQINTADLTLDLSNYQVRYAKQWFPLLVETDYNTLTTTNQYPGSGTPDITMEQYKSQMLWKEPGDNTVLTLCSYHAPKGKVVVVTLGGTAKVLDTKYLEKVPGTSGHDFDTYKLRF